MRVRLRREDWLPDRAAGRVIAGAWMAFHVLTVGMLVLLAAGIRSEMFERDPVEEALLAATGEEILAAIGSGATGAAVDTGATGTGADWWFLAVSPIRVDRSTLELELRALPLGDGVSYYGDAYSIVDRDIRYLTALARVLDQPGGPEQSPYSVTVPASSVPRSALRLATRPSPGEAGGQAGSPFLYPFDTYRYRSLVNIGVRPGGVEAASDAPFRVRPILPCFVDGGRCAMAGSMTVDGFDLEFRPDPVSVVSDGPGLAAELPSIGRALRENGQLGRTGVRVEAARSLPERLYVVLVLVALQVTLVAVWKVLRSVRRGQRPPTGEILVWVAALTFALLAIRSGLDVPLGVGLDHLFLLNLLFTVLATLELGTYWVTRSDFDGARS